MKPFLYLAGVFGLLLVGYLFRMVDASRPDDRSDPVYFIVAMCGGVLFCLIICVGIAIARSDRKCTDVAP